MQTGTMQASGAIVSGANISIAGKTYQPPSWATGTPEDIETFLDLYYSGKIGNLWGFWSEGQEREIELSDGTTVTYVIQYGSYELVNSIHGISSSAFIVYPKYITHYGRIAESKRGWSASEMRSWCNNDFLDLFPAKMRSLFKEYVSPANANDYFCIPEDIEYGARTTPSGEETTYWTFSYSSNYAGEYYYVNTSGGINSGNYNVSRGRFPIGTI